MKFFLRYFILKRLKQNRNIRKILSNLSHDKRNEEEKEKIKKEKC